MVAPTQLLVSFCGGQFRKSMRTQYTMEFETIDSQTIVTLSFKSEMLKLPPMTPISDIDQFMKQKMSAVRCTNDHNSNENMTDATHSSMFFRILKKVFCTTK